MNREIKFRLIIGSVVVGYEKWYPGAGDKAKPQWLYSANGEHWTPEYIHHYSKDQFTGLRDKNGVEIYEGDIVKLDGFIHTLPDSLIIQQVIFRNGAFVCGQSGMYFWDYAQGMDADDTVEVIGNIHENGDLLK